MATSVKLDDDLKSRIQHLADIRHRSAHWIMREAIRDYVEREEARERFKQEALASWKAYQETGKPLQLFDQIARSHHHGRTVAYGRDPVRGFPRPGSRMRRGDLRLRRAP